MSAAAVAVGWSQYLNQLLDNLFGFRIPDSAVAGARAGRGVQPARGHPGRAVRAAADPGRQRVGQDQRRHGADQDRRAGACSSSSACMGWNADNLRRLRAVRLRRHHRGGRHHLLLLHRSGRRLDRGRGGEEPAPDHAAGDPDRAGHGHRAVHPGRRRRGRRPAVRPSSRARRPGWPQILENVTGAIVAGHRARRRRGDLDLQRDPGGDLRPDPHPVRDGRATA